MSEVRIAVHGAGGRMGRQLLGVIGARADTVLVAAVDAAGAPCVGADAALLAPGLPAGVLVGDDVSVLEDAAAASSRATRAVTGAPGAAGVAVDVVVDFSLPRASLALLDALPSGLPLVLGTTGFDAAGLAAIERHARTRPIVFAANYSAGVTVALELLARAAGALGEGYDIEISEAHHKHKIDAPSGTALAMGRAVAGARGRALDDVAVYAREGITGPRPDGAIGFATVRAGEIVGEHSVLFAGEGERLEIRHAADDRATFARGAVRAAVWLAGRVASAARATDGSAGPAGSAEASRAGAAGLHDMRDVLGLTLLGRSSEEDA